MISKVPGVLSVLRVHSLIWHMPKNTVFTLDMGSLVCCTKMDRRNILYTEKKM